MEQVLELFARARRQQLSLAALKVALEGLLTRSPQGLSQGLAWLDMAQQREPIPVTDFVTLRQDLADHLRLARLSRADDMTRIGKPGEVTEIQREMTVRRDAPHLPSEETLAASANALGDATLVAPLPPPHSADATLVAPAPPSTLADATLVAPAPPPHSTDATLVAPVPPPHSTDATLVAPVPPPHSTDATLVAPAPPPQSADATGVAARPGPAPGAAESTLAAPSLDPSAPSPHERKALSKPTIALAAVVTLAIAVVVVMTASEPENQAKSAVSAGAATASGQQVLSPSADIQRPPEAATTPPAINGSPGLDEPATQSDVDADTPIAVLKLEVEKPPVTPEAPLPSSMKELAALLDQRIMEGQLDPALGSGSAGHVLATMVARDKSDALVGDGRSKLADAHRVLAKQARESGDLDAAQRHMDHAYDALLMGVD